MLYDSFRLWFWILNTAFYRRVYYLGGEHIPPKGTATIYASNHTNGFMDPVLISDYQRRPVYFWVAASEIPNNIQGKIMGWLHSIPIYRAQEGNMHRNKATFERTKAHLATGWDAMFIAPEGRCAVQKHLFPLKKGCVRLSFELLEEQHWQMPVTIVPTGMNYTYHTQFRSEVYLSFGPPLRINDYRAAYEADREAAIAQVTTDLRAGIRAQMVYLEPEDAALTEDLLPLLRHTFRRGGWPTLSRDPQYLRAEQRLARHVGALDAAEKATLEKETADYYTALERAKADDFAVAGVNRRSALVVLLGAPIWLVGTLVGGLPHALGRALRDKLAPSPEFWVSFTMTAGFFAWIFWALVVVVVSAFWIGWWALLLPPLMVVAQLYAYHYRDYVREWSALRRYRRLPPETRRALEQQRAGLSCIQP